MKHFYFLMAALIVSTFALAQSPIITSIVDGDCTGGTPKVLEIFANGTVDFTQFSVQLQTNGGTTWSTTPYSLAAFGTRTNSFIYLTTNVTAGNSNAIALASEFPGITASNVMATSITNFNGDDSVRIINASTMAVIDQYGVDGVDGTGEVWEYADGFSKRVNGTGPEAVFNPASWTFNNGRLDTFGTCQGGPDTFQSIMGGIGTYSTVPNTNPTLSILSPVNGSILDNGNFDVTLNVTNFMVAMTGGNGYITYRLDANATVNKFNTTPISFTNVTPGAHTIVVNLVNNSGAPLSPAVSQTINVTVSNNVQVQNIAALRAVTLPSTDVFTLSNAVIVTHKQSFRNQIWIEDSSAAVVIDDPSGTITTALAVGDGLTGISGRLNEFGGLLQFTPTTNTGAPSSTGNTVNPQTVTIAMLNANPESYESEFVSIQNATFTNANGTNVFANNAEEPITVGTATYTVRSVFGADYIGSVIPAGAGNVTGVILQRNNTEYSITPRNAGDIATLSTTSTVKTVFSIYPNPVNDGRFNVISSNGEQVDVTIFSLLGQQVGSFKNVANTVSVTNLTSGVYLVKIAQGTNVDTLKLIIE